MNELIKSEAPMSWEQKKEMATMLIKSGFLSPAFKTPEQVIAVTLKGQELGIPTMEALTSINVIAGKPTISPQLMLALARRTGQLADFQMEQGADFVKVTVTRKGQSPVVTTFGKKQADSLGLSGKDNYKKQAQVMYQWRALAANLRLTFPDVISGMYSPEEMGAEVIVSDEGGMEVASLPESTAFDPATTHIEKGKYSGVLWVELPADYIEWASKQSGDLRDKALATIEYKNAFAKPEEPSIAKEMFPEPFEILSSSLDEASRQCSEDALNEWAKLNKEKIEALGDTEKGLLRKGFTNAMSLAKKGKDVPV